EPGIGEIGKGMRRAAREELARGKAAATDADRLGADGAGGGDVARGVADDDHAAPGQRPTEDTSAARRADAQDLAALLVIAAEAPEAEALEDAERPKLRASAGADVARAEADGDGAAGGGCIERVVDARVQSKLRRLGDFGLQERDIRREHAVDRRLGVRSDDRLADRRERSADDRAVGHAVEHHVAENGRAPIPHPEDALEGAAPDSCRREEGAVDVEEQDRRTRHGAITLHAGPLEVDHPEPVDCADERLLHRDSPWADSPARSPSSPAARRASAPRRSAASRKREPASSARTSPTRRASGWS